MVIGADFQDYNGGDTVAVAKFDTTGVIMKTKTLIPNENIVFEGSDVTFDNKVILVGNTILSWQYCYLFKLNSDLEYDSIYNTPFTYDSLCPYPIVSDTIPLADCEEVIVGVDEALRNPETTKLHVYPNPAKNRITFELPKYLIKRTRGFGITATTVYHQWKEVQLEVFDLFGRLVYNEVIPQQEKSIELDISTWPEGMYVARVVFMNEVVGRVKFVIN
ncbi:MAG: T9SS type A sorting domain-containing protein [Bacteroidales bacterium]|nr:T9SS type A sorting domain-containing protein [Bacteroidales bacterium]